MHKTLTILGSSGSIGTQSLDVARKNGYSIFGLSVHFNIDILEKQIYEFRPHFVSVVNETAAEILKQRLLTMENAPTVLAGQQSTSELAAMEGADILLNAIVGIAGLSPTLAAISSGKDIALANKESLVTGGQLVMDAVKKHNVKLLPVDSEHSAIFQCLQNTSAGKEVKKIILTASGGPFYGFDKTQLEKVTKKDALKHPNWEMGAKITIDSATMMNKGLEFIEAMWLFDLLPSQIDILVHQQSVIHSMVEFNDHAILAQLGVPDMHIPIQYALTWPNRLPSEAPPLNFTNYAALTFGMPDEETFRCLKACKKAITKGVFYPCIANGANEMAVELFLQEKIKFLDIGRLVEAAVDKLEVNLEYNLENIYYCDKLAREFVYSRSLV